MATAPQFDHVIENNDLETALNKAHELVREFITENSKKNNWFDFWRHKKIGLFFGTFNPIHIGHLIIGNHFVEHTALDEVWFVVTPHNPHKKRAICLKTIID